MQFARMVLLTLTTSALFIHDHLSAQTERPYRPVTFQGCVQATGNPEIFLFVVPGRFPDPDRGLATGEPVPDGANVGPAPRADPLTAPPKFPEDEPGRPQGRYDTPTMQHRTYRLTELDGERLAPLVGAHVEIAGDVPVEGFPSGDAPARESAAGGGGNGSSFPTLRARTVTKVADTCLPFDRVQP